MDAVAVGDITRDGDERLIEAIIIKRFVLNILDVSSILTELYLPN